MASNNNRSQLLAEWQAWTLAADLTEFEQRDRQTAFKRLEQCIENGGRTLYLSALNLTKLPANLPDLLEELVISDNLLNGIPERLPASLILLNVSRNRLTNLPAHLPTMLKHIIADNNLLQSLPQPLPTSLQTLNVYNNSLTELKSDWPISLLSLDISYNPINVLPENLPHSLRLLWAKGNGLINLPPCLPDSLQILDVSYNRLNYLSTPLPPFLCELIIRGNQLANLPDNLPHSLTTIDVSNNALTVLPVHLPSSLAILDMNYNPINRTSVHIDNVVVYNSGNIAKTYSVDNFITVIKYWTTNNIEQWKLIYHEPYADEFTPFLLQLNGSKNRKSDIFKQHIAYWLDYLSSEEQRELRESTFLMASDSDGHCIDHSSFYFNNMYLLMLEDQLLKKKEVSVDCLFKSILGLFRLQLIESIAAEEVKKRQINSPNFIEEIEVYLAYQCKLRDKLSLPIYTELQFSTIANVTDSDVSAALVTIEAQEKKHFLRYLVTESSLWTAALERWDKQKKQLVDDNYLEVIIDGRLEHVVDKQLLRNNIAVNDMDARRIVSKQITDAFFFEKRYQLSREFLSAHHALALIDRFDGLEKNNLCLLE